MALTTINYLGLTFRCDHYYIKRSRIVEKITFQNRTFYAKFERIDTPPDQTLITQHQKGEFSIALPLVSNQKVNYCVIEYKGQEPMRFAHTSGYLLSRQKIDGYAFYQTKRQDKVQLFIPLEHHNLELADSFGKRISMLLQSKLSPAWKVLPSIQLPEAYNIVTLPHQRLELSRF